jgi:bifunctional DNA-binding transcriptional regulator/antitoxin component of YhaV-PrlF toxin-antitoxin module
MSVISTKNQLTLPVEAMRAAGFSSGDDVQVVSSGPGRIEIVATDALIAHAVAPPRDACARCAR